MVSRRSVNAAVSVTLPSNSSDRNCWAGLIAESIAVEARRSSTHCCKSPPNLCVAKFVLTNLDVCYKISSMKQASLNLDLLSKKTRKQTFLEEMEKVVPWTDLEALIARLCQRLSGAVATAPPSL